MTQSMISGDRAQKRAAALAVILGGLIRTIGLSIPGTVGPLAVCVGMFMAWPPLGVISLGLVLWALDRRVP